MSLGDQSYEMWIKTLLLNGFRRPARTVVVGGLANAEMLEAVRNEAKKAGTIETVQKTMTELELTSRGTVPYSLKSLKCCRPRDVLFSYQSSNCSFVLVISRCCSCIRRLKEMLL